MHLQRKRDRAYITNRGLSPPTLPLSVAQTGRNNLNEEITNYPPPPLTGIGERCSQTIANLGHAALRPM
jgi:hypothetical protein